MYLFYTYNFYDTHACTKGDYNKYKYFKLTVHSSREWSDISMRIKNSYTEFKNKTDAKVWFNCHSYRLISMPNIKKKCSIFQNKIMFILINLRGKQY